LGLPALASLTKSSLSPPLTKHSKTTADWLTAPPDGEILAQLLTEADRVRAADKAPDLS
jgi:hypothetical protein